MWPNRKLNLKLTQGYFVRHTKKYIILFIMLWLSLWHGYQVNI